MPEDDAGEHGVYQVTIEPGVAIVYHDTDGLTADTVVRVDGEFIDVGGNKDSRWLRIDDVVATGIYGDEEGVEVVLGDTGRSRFEEVSESDV